MHAYQYYDQNTTLIYNGQLALNKSNKIIQVLFSMVAK